MDFAGELDAVRAFLAGGQFRLAVIGGVALGAYGNPRMTLDLDVATESSAQETTVPRVIPTIATPVVGE